MSKIMPAPMISHLGHHLSIVIRADQQLHHEWMSFATWYSLTKFLPDAQISIVCTRSRATHDFFTWPRRVGVPIRLYSSKNGEVHPMAFAAHIALRENIAFEPLMIIEAEVMAIRDIRTELLDIFNRSGFVRSQDDAIWWLKDREKETLLKTDPAEANLINKHLCADASSSDLSAFASYRQGVGNFVTADWIHKKEYPFPHADRFAGNVMTANEVQILKLWKQMNPVFATVSRG